MSLAEQLSPDYEHIVSSPAQEIAYKIRSLLTPGTGKESPLYRPDYMSEDFANEVVAELGKLGVEAAAAPTWLKKVPSEPGRSHAIQFAPKQTPINILPFPQQ